MAQKNLLKLLQLLDDTCRLNNIEYWIDGGTFLGAVRNGKFIPWDDDIDICLLPNEYVKLIQIIKKNIIPNNKKYFLYNDHRIVPHWSEYLTNSNTLKNYHLPYQIDIVMVKSLPNEEHIIRKDKSIMNIAHFFHRYRYKHPEQVLLEDKSAFLTKGLVLFRKKKFVNYFIKDYAAGLNKKHKDHLYCYVYNDLYVQKDREYYVYDDIFPLKEIEFEGIMVKCPNNADTYLTKLYGNNYISPPPIDQQNPSADQITVNKYPPIILKMMIFILYLLKDIKKAFLISIAKK